MSIGARGKTGFLLKRPQNSTDWGGDGYATVRSLVGDLRPAPVTSRFGYNKMLETATHTLFVNPREDIRLDDRLAYKEETYRVVNLSLPTLDAPRYKTIFLELVK